MKKQLLALTLLATPGLMADNDVGAQQNNCEQTRCSDCRCSPCACEPCCVPKPKKCIDCECYTPAYYDLQCAWGANLSIDFLYWYARETNLSHAVEGTLFANTTANNFLFQPTSYEHLDTQWSPGFRVGLGWDTECDGWDSNLNWTYMNNKKSQTTSVDPLVNTTFTEGASAPVLFNPWVNLGVFPFTSVKAKWALQFNQVDLELGRKFWLSPCTTLRPYAALRGGWMKARFKTTSVLETTSTTTPQHANVVSKFTTRDWGVGFLGGLQPEWNFCSNFILYSNFDVALLWGEFKVSGSQSGTFTGIPSSAALTTAAVQSTTSKFFQIFPVLDVAIGLRWEETWCCDRYRTALDIGWEHHAWLDMNHRMKQLGNFTSSGVGLTAEDPDAEGVAADNLTQGPFSGLAGIINYAEATGNLGLGGLVVRLRFDF